MNDAPKPHPRLRGLPGVQTTTALLVVGLMLVVLFWVVVALRGQLTTLS